MSRQRKLKLLASYGPSRNSVRVKLALDETTVIVQWTEHGIPRQKSWPNTAENRREAKAWARGFAEARDSTRREPSKRTTVRGLWELYVAAEFGHLRENSQRNYTEHWHMWELFAGRAFIAEDATLEMVDEFRQYMVRKGYSVSTIGSTIRTVRRVYNWGDGRELLSRNRVARYRYKVRKEERTTSPDEYRAAEFQAIMAALDPADHDQWRPYCVLTICGHQGARQHAVLHLRWEDVDVRRRRIVWRARWDKLGNEWEQPLRRATVRALRIARDWARARGKASPWIFPAGSKKSRRETYSAQSLWRALYLAEERAGVESKRRRGAHGLRRMLAGDVAELTGDAILALRSIGDTDIRMASRYIKNREDRVGSAFRTLDRSAPDSRARDRDQTPTETGHPVESGPLTPDTEA